MRAIATCLIVVLSALYVSAAWLARDWHSPSTQSFIPTLQRRDELADEQDIKETVFRYQFEHNGSGQQQNAKVYFLSFIEGRDPSNDFLNRFRDHTPPVKKVSQAAVSANGVMDKRTGQRGLLFRIIGVKWLSENEVEVEGGYFESGQSASRGVYNVRRVNDKWVVQREKIKRIS